MFIGARRGGARCHAPLWPDNTVIKPNFQSAIFQTNNGCSLLSLTLAKLLLLGTSCKNIFALFLVTALTVCPFSTKKVYKNSLAAKGVAPRSPVGFPFYQILGAPLHMSNAIGYRRESNLSGKICHLHNMVAYR